jgi:hypothetical protein
LALFSRWEDWLQKNPRTAALALFLSSFVLYASSLANGFVYDDEYQILQNPFVTNPHLWTKIFTGSVWSFQAVAFPTNYYRPLHIFTHWVIYRLAGPNPAAFHLFQVLMYAGTVVLVFQIARRMLRNEVAAFAGAVLWAVHPLHVEAVAWIAAVPDTGYGFFYLLGFLAFLRAEERNEGAIRAHVIAALAFFPALFFKEMALSFPLLILAYWFFFPRFLPGVTWRDRGVHVVPYAATIAAYLLIRVMALGYVTQAGNLWKVSWRVIGAAVGLFGQHTKLFIWPTDLNVFRTFDLEASLRSPWPWIVLAAVGTALLLRKREPVLAFLLVWWPIGLLPSLDIRQLSFPLLAERFSYVPSLALCLAVSFVLLDWLPRHVPALRPGRAAVPALTLAMILAAVQTVRAIPNWRDNQTLADYSMKQSPDAALLHLIRALVLQYQQGDLQGARAEYETAMRLNRASAKPLAKVTYDSYVGLGLIAHQQGRVDEAIQFLESAVRASPHDSPAYDALGAIYFPRGDYARAAEYFAQAVRENPHDVSGRFYLGTCWMKLGQFAEAARQYRTAREIDPSFIQAYEAEAKALEAAGLHEEAARVRRLAPHP